jgi:hypothetical protein
MTTIVGSSSTRGYSATALPLQKLSRSAQPLPSVDSVPEWVSALSADMTDKALAAGNQVVTANLFLLGAGLLVFGGISVIGGSYHALLERNKKNRSQRPMWQ